MSLWKGNQVPAQPVKWFPQLKHWLGFSCIKACLLSKLYYYVDNFTVCLFVSFFLSFFLSFIHSFFLCVLLFSFFQSSVWETYFVIFSSDLSMCLSGTKQLAEEFGVSESLMKLISEGLMETPQHDLRSQFQEPLFRRSVTSLEDIHAEAVLTGNIFILLSLKVNMNVVDEMGKNSMYRNCNWPDG